MSNQSKSRKSLWMGILAAVVVLTMVLCMAGCNNEQAEGTTTAPATTVGGGEAERIDLYWNMDRELYDGMSEAGMSSREPAEDGYFHVRFFKDGEIVELRVADRKTVNAMEVQSLMGLEFDEDGLVVGIIPVDDLPIEKLAWQFYVQSAGGKLIKANSSASLNGMEILLETNENTGIYDMTGLSGDVGCVAEPMQLDRVLALGNADGEVSHVFIYERPNYMKTHEGECEHCKKTVTWYEWTKENKLPINTGHYQLMNDLSKVTQCSMVEDAKICLDLNGHRVDGNSGSRIYSLHNAGTELAIMDTSEAKTGRIAAHGTGDQGMCVWLRYGVFYLYDGILDGSDATTFLNGPTVNMGSNTYFYMYGGELIGGTADTKSNGKGGWTGGVGGTLFVGANSKFVMYDGMIRDGYAKAKITKYDATGKPTGYSCGVGGNIFANTGAVIEMHGGTIRDGRAVTYGNISLGSKAEMTMNAGLIAGGSLYFPSSNGGNIGVGGNANFIMNGGTIRNGRSYNCGGNLYLNGRFQMNDGIITDGKILKWGTNEINDASGSRNVFVVNGDFIMYGGRVAGGMELIDTNYKSDPTVLLVSARSVIFDEDGTGPHVRFATYNGGGNIDFYVGQLHDEAKIGISAVQKAVFTLPTAVENADNFVSDIPEAEIIWSEEGIAIGKYACICGVESDNIADHIGDCDGTQHIWAGTASLPTTSGYFYLTKDFTTNQAGITSAEHQEVHLNLNGKTVTCNARAYLMQQQNLLTISDHVGGGKILMGGSNNNNAGGILMQGKSHIKMYGGTLGMKPGANQTSTLGGIVEVQGVFDMYGGTIEGGYANQAGNVWVSNTGIFNLYDGTVKNGVATKYNGGNFNVQAKGVLNVYGGLITGGTSPDSGGNIVCYGELNIAGGTIMNGYAAKGNGYNISVVSSGDGQLRTLNLTGGTIAGGVHLNNYLAPYTNVNISGNPVIDSSLATENTPNFPFRISRTKMINIGTLTEGAEIHIDGASGLFTNPTAKGNEKYFVSDVANCTVVWTEAGLEHGELGGCICGGKAVGMEGHTCAPALWTPWTSTTSLPTAAGNYYLTADIVRNDQTVVYGQNVAIDLRGHNITFNVPIRNDGYRFLRVQRNVDGNNVAYGPGANVYFTDSTSNPGTVKVAMPDYSGASAETQTKMLEGNQGMLFWLWDQSSITIFDGIFDASQVAATKKDGATIAMSGNTAINMYGGTIKPGKIGWSSNIYVPGNANFNMYGGTVTGGKANNGGNFGVYGTLTIKGGTVTGGIATSNGGNIRVNDNGKLVMTGGTVSYGTAPYGGNIAMTSKANVQITGGTITEGDGIHTDGYAQGGNIYANGGTLTINGKVTVSNGYLSSSKGWAPGGNIYANNGAVVTIDGGATVTGGGAASGPDGHNIYLTTNSTKLTLGNCTIHNTSNNSGNICVEGGTVTVNGATISNVGTNASNFRCNNTSGCVANFIINSGTITGGTNANIVVYQDDVCTMNGGTISNGSATYGGNVYLGKNGSFNLKGGTITGGKATTANAGGNVAMEGTSVFNMTGGTITKGVATGKGGNVGIWPGTTFHMSGGTISYGKGTQGGNIITEGTLNISGGIIEEGTITNGNGGGNIRINGGNVNISGGIIRWGKLQSGDSYNYAETSSNIRVETGNLNMTGGHVYGRIVSSGSGVMNISGSAKIYYMNGSGVAAYNDNNLTVSGTINIGKLNSDAAIGVMTTEAKYVANTDSNLTQAFANIVDGASINPSQFYGRTVIYDSVTGKWVGNSDYKVVADGGKLYLVPTTP